MRKIFPQIILSVCIVFIPTAFAYDRLAPITEFWNAQSFWNVILGFCWIIVTIGYYHQGWLVYKHQNAKNVSIVLPIAVFIVQCILFVKGIFYNDWSLVMGAVLVNSGVTFSLSQIIKVSRPLGRPHYKLK